MGYGVSPMVMNMWWTAATLMTRAMMLCRAEQRLSTRSRDRNLGMAAKSAGYRRGRRHHVAERPLPELRLTADTIVDVDTGRGCGSRVQSSTSRYRDREASGEVKWCPS